MDSRFSHIPDVVLGEGVDIHPSVQIGGLRRLVLGDYTTLGPGVRVFGGGELVVGDYGKLHNNVTVCAKGRVVLGHNAWVGQNSHLDGTGELVAGDFLGVGIGSSLYSHIRHGDLLEGCNYERDSRLLIGHDVWFVGMVLVSPVRCADKSMALLGSVVTRNLAENRLYAGNPAVDVTETYRRAPFRAVPVEEKAERLRGFLDTYFTTVAPAADRERVRVVTEFPSATEPGVTYYNVATREYTKTRHPEEVALHQWLFPCKAKFRPAAASAP